MTTYYKYVVDGYLEGIGTNGPDTVDAISESEYNTLLGMIRARPDTPEGYDYRLKADTLEWELVALPVTEDDALVRYSNELTGGTDETLTEATETLIKIVKGVAQ
jgi:hypothetical protein